jgi:hypothetical protein
MIDDLVKCILRQHAHDPHHFTPEQAEFVAEQLLENCVFTTSVCRVNWKELEKDAQSKIHASLRISEEGNQLVIHASSLHKQERKGKARNVEEAEKETQKVQCKPRRKHINIKMSGKYGPWVDSQQWISYIIDLDGFFTMQLPLRTPPGCLSMHLSGLAVVLPHSQLNWDLNDPDNEEFKEWHRQRAIYYQYLQQLPQVADVLHQLPNNQRLPLLYELDYFLYGHLTTCSDHFCAESRNGFSFIKDDIEFQLYRQVQNPQVYLQIVVPTLECDHVPLHNELDAAFDCIALADKKWQLLSALHVALKKGWQIASLHCYA